MRIGGCKQGDEDGTDPQSACWYDEARAIDGGMHKPKEPVLQPEPETHSAGAPEPQSRARRQTADNKRGGVPPYTYKYYMVRCVCARITDAIVVG